MPAPLITIGMTCYNAADTIGRAIIGALAQDYPNFEIVIVDDGSTDESFSILENFQQEHPDKIIVFRNAPNLGVAGTRNRIIEKARGEIIVFFDDDDDNLPNRLSIQFKTLTDYEQRTGADAVLCFSSVCRKYPNGYELHIPSIGSRPVVPVGQDIVAANLFLDTSPEVSYGGGTPSCSMMIRKSVLLKAGGYDPKLRRIEDTDLVIRLGEMGAHFTGCREECVIQYATAGQDKSANAGLESELYLVDKYKDILDRYGRYQYARDWIYVRYYHFSGQKMRAILQVLKMAFKYPALTLKRFWKAAPKRLIHEWKMKRNGGQKI